MGRYKILYESENELCEAFAKYAEDMGWVVYPETSECDMLLVATEGVKTRGVRPGEQLTVEAKLRDGIEVLAQAMPSNRMRSGPNFVGVLVPRATLEFAQVAHRLGIKVFSGQKEKWAHKGKEWARHLEGLEIMSSRYHLFDEPLWLPEVRIWVPPGVPNPSYVTQWKMQAVKLCIHGLRRGYLTTADFIEFSVDTTLWFRHGWIEDTGEKIGRRKKYRVNKKRAPHTMYPEIFDALLQRAAKQ